MPVRTMATAVAALLTTTMLAACSDVGSEQRPQAVQVADGTTEQQVADVKGRRVEVVAVGDIVCPPGARVTKTTCRHGATARLTKRIDPKAVLALGDLQYDDGTLADFRDAYDESWGDLRSITYPTPGNHEYGTKDAAGYFSYFSKRTPPSPGWYAFDLGRWRAYSLNSNCPAVDCDAQAKWLVKDLSDNPGKCSVIISHHPRYSTGAHGDNPFMKRFFRIAFRHGVDLMLAGHDHHYERFQPMNHDGELRKRGVVSFISGGGGKSHYAADGNQTGSEYVEDDTFGVLRLVLRPDSFSYGFRGIDGSRQDTGTRDCV